MWRAILITACLIPAGLLFADSPRSVHQPFVSLPPAPQEVSVELEEVSPAAEQYIGWLQRTTAPAELPLQGELVFWPEQVRQGTAELYDEPPVRYLMVQLRVANRGKQPFTIDPRAIALRSAGNVYSPVELPGRFPEFDPDSTFWDADAVRVRLTEVPALDVPAGETRSVNLIFAHLPALPVLLDFVLQIPAQDRSHQIDLRACSLALLKMQAERIGPGGALGLIRIAGKLDSLNCTALADQLQTWTQLGVERFVIHWSPQAQPVHEAVLSWLIALNEVPDPALPRITRGRDLRLAGIPQHADSEGYNFRSLLDSLSVSRIHDRLDEAAQESLRPVVSTVSSRVLHEELLQGHPLSIAAILRTAGSRLEPADLSRLLELTNSPHASLRVAALETLGGFEASAAIKRLEQALKSSDLPEVRAAVIAVLKGTSPAATSLQQQILAQPPLPREELIRLLEQFPVPQAVDFVIAALSDPQPQTRKTALQTIARLGHPQLLELLSRSLADPDESLRELAVEILIEQRSGPASEQALRYIQQQLQQGRFNTAWVEFISRVRDPRLASILLEQLDQQSPDDQATILGLIGQIGDEQVAPALVARFDTVDLASQAAILDALRMMQARELRPLALALLDHESLPLRGRALDILVEDGRAEVEPILIDRLQRLLNEPAPADAGHVESLVNALARLNGPRSRPALERFRDACYQRQDFPALELVLEALQQQFQYSPAHQTALAGLYHWRQGEIEDAIKYYSLAAEIDPTLAEVFSSRGSLYLKLDQLEPAARDFQRAFELNPFDGQAITGLGIVWARQGKPEAAVRLTIESADKFPGDYIYAYNTGCVYGRAVEFLKTQPESPERNRLIAEYTGAAIERLTASILGTSPEHGRFDDLDLLLTDPDLDALRDDPRFPEVVRQLREII
jgi:HEAT repeat protein